MKKIVLLIILTCLFSCKNSQKESITRQKETEGTPKENILKPKTEEHDVKRQLLKLTSETKSNIIHCENKKFIIKVDRLKNGGIRYTSWNKPKTISDKPNLLLYDGKIEQQGTGGGYHYIFTSGKWSYIIENNLMGETAESMGIFLKLLNLEEKLIYSKMTNLTTKKIMI
ncbi:hypothetical protein [Pseudofulvibacter geojedonensis]|uniref:Lipoprotein n=1 Tax=Pseudofulvibacter geojedonensis TaxID=1123758 RepID=A0ABW3I494_9FLAO